VACGVAGVGFVILIGAALKNVTIFMAYDESVQEAFFSKGGSSWWPNLILRYRRGNIIGRGGWLWSVGIWHGVDD
jgi:hypothetical protein